MKKKVCKEFKMNNLGDYHDLYVRNDENSNKGYILKVDVKYAKYLHDLRSDLPFLPERMKIDECNKLVCNLYDRKTLST